MPLPLLSVLSYGSYLPHLASCWPELAARAQHTAPEVLLGELEQRYTLQAGSSSVETAISLRKLKQQLALILGYAELCGTLPVMRQTKSLSDFAAYAVAAALQSALNEAAENQQIEPVLLENCGITVIGMGKLGADELNFSSDIDIIVFYDKAKITRLLKKGEASPFMVRLTRQLIAILSDQTEGGYVFRTDLRLRPDPASTPLAVSLEAAETYYSAIAATWERAAMIKARAIAGDSATAKDFAALMRPFIWRRHLDFAALEDIHQIKKQINPQRDFSAAAPGLNIKTGLGGIREIEFFAQTQQLVWGGRDPSLRVRETLAALECLHITSRLDAATTEGLSEAYLFLRQLEHRLQLLHDAQTHTLPQHEEDTAQLAASFGLSVPGLYAALDERRRFVSAAYGALFADAAAQAQPSLTVYTDDTNAEALQELAHLGYAEPKVIAACLQKWHNHGYRVLMLPRAQQLLIELTPALLKAAASTSSPDAAILSFDKFLSQLNAGVQMFSLLRANPELLQTLAEMLGEAPQLADRLALQPHLLDTLLIADPLEAFPGPETLRAELTAALRRVETTEDRLRALSIWHRDWLFRLHMHIFRRSRQAVFASAYLTVLADTAVSTALDIVRRDMSAAHGTFPGGACAVLALGKQGSGEMTVNSDLDLMFVYDAPDPHALSDGAKPLSPPVYYTRLCQRLVSMLSLPAPGSIEPLYQVDLRLRPEGNAAHAATSYNGFRSYYTTGSAQTWEYQALTRARVVAGDERLRDALDDNIHDFLCRPRDAHALQREVLDMRERLHLAHPPRDVFHIKHTLGGMVDVEFAAQFLQLKYAPDYPAVLQRGTRACLMAIAKLPVPERGDAEFLASCYNTYRELQNLTRLTLGSVSPRLRASAGLKQKIAEVLGAVDFASAEVYLSDIAAAAYAAVMRLLTTKEQTPP